jgi:hypothetical protein
MIYIDCNVQVQCGTIRILYNVAACLLYLKEYINDAQSHERQIEVNHFHASWNKTLLKSLNVFYAS